MEKKQTILTAVLTVVLFIFAYFLGQSAAYFMKPAEETSGEGNWGLGFGEPGTTPAGNVSQEELLPYDAYYTGKPDDKVIYLTFDCGYENGNTEAILDTLKEQKVPATFFIVGHYLETSPLLVKRMVDDGHVVGNHTYHHPDMSKMTSKEDFSRELRDLEALYEKTIGSPMTRYYRPPQGKYLKENLETAKELGYHTFFWSLAHVDWLQDDQPDPDAALEKLLGRVHPGALILLHNTSSSNAQILGELITTLKAQGYRFEPLSHLISSYKEAPVSARSRTSFTVRMPSFTEKRIS